MNIMFNTAAISSAGSTNYEQMSQAFHIASIVLFVLAIICLILGVVTFIVFKIPTIIGDLSGRNARKSIDQMRESNEKGGKKSYRPHPVAAERGPLTEPIKTGKKESKKAAKAAKTSPVTRQSTPPDGSGATDVLADPSGTVKLDYDANGTEILSSGTEVLSEQQISNALNNAAIKAPNVNMIQEIIFVHTDEAI